MNWDERRSNDSRHKDGKPGGGGSNGNGGGGGGGVLMKAVGWTLFGAFLLLGVAAYLFIKHRRTGGACGGDHIATFLNCTRLEEEEEEEEEG